MANSFTSLFVHVVFSTKDREPWLKRRVRDRLFAYIGGVANESKHRPVCVGGVADHVHALLCLPPSVSVSRAAQLIKGSSSRWIHETFPSMRSFAWQEGYGAFSVGVSQVPATKAYIARQAEHHRKVSFQEEYLAFLRKNRIEYDERYVWG